ncbi:MAG TPA: hypothetical protein VF290_02830 [Pyrinomonadaceae bacterium]
MKKVFALRGRRNVGKSQTIRTADELLRAKYPDAGVEHERRTKAEVSVVLSINGVKMGVESAGANQGSLDHFVSLGCDVIICSTRTTGKTVNAVKALPGYEVVWLQQQSQSAPFEQVLSNLAMARHIVEETEKSIASAKPALLSRAAGR